MVAYNKKPGNAADIKPSAMGLFTLQAGTDVQLQVNSQWRLSTGIALGHYGIAYKTSGKLSQGGKGWTDNVLRIPFTVQYMFMDNLRILNVDKTQLAYLLMFRLYGLAGVHYTHVLDGHNSYADSSQVANIWVYRQSRVITNKHSAGIFLGIGMQFFDRADNDRFDISIFYSKGLARLAYQDVSYEANNSVQIIRLQSRGSFIGCTIAYPIRLKSFP